MYLVQLLLLLPWGVHSFGSYSQSTAHAPENREIPVNKAAMVSAFSRLGVSRVWAMAGTRGPLSEWRQSLALPPWESTNRSPELHSKGWGLTPQKTLKGYEQNAMYQADYKVFLAGFY